MQDRPTAKELTETVRQFLEEQVLPKLEDPMTGYRAQVAANALSILERELDRGEGLLKEEHERLVRLLGENQSHPSGSLEELRDRVSELNRELAGRIRSGEAPEGTFEHLMRTVTGKLEVVSPDYLERAG